MKPIIAAALALTLGFSTWMIFMLDAWLGITAYSIPYLAFCALFASALGAIWHLSFRKYTAVFAALTFAVLSLPWQMPAPSERLLRTAMLSVPRKASAATIQSAVRTAYLGSAYRLPEITSERRGDAERIYVSLRSQEAGNCTAIVFLIQGGVVVHREYSPD